MTKKTKSNYLHHFLHVMVFTFVFLLYGLYISPLLWHQGSSAAFKTTIFIWVVLLAWMLYLVLPPTIKLHSWWQKIRKA